MNANQVCHDVDHKIASTPGSLSTEASPALIFETVCKLVDETINMLMYESTQPPHDFSVSQRIDFTVNQDHQMDIELFLMDMAREVRNDKSILSFDIFQDYYDH